MDELLTITEATKLYPNKTHRSTVLRHILRGVKTPVGVVKLEGWRYGGRWTTSREAVDRFMALDGPGRSDATQDDEPESLDREGRGLFEIAGDALSHPVAMAVLRADSGLLLGMVVHPAFADGFAPRAPGPSHAYTACPRITRGTP